MCLGGQGGDEIFGGYARYAVGYLEQALKDAIFGTGEESEDVISLASIVPNLASLKQYVPMLKRTFCATASSNHGAAVLLAGGSQRGHH